MKIFSVYTLKNDQEQEPILVEQVFFSFWALIFNFIWALYHRMWSVGIAAFFISLIPAMLKNYPAIEPAAFAFDIALLFIFGFFSSEMREFYLEKKGYALTDIVMAHNMEEAEVRFITRSADQSQPSPDIEVWQT